MQGKRRVGWSKAEQQQGVSRGEVQMAWGLDLEGHPRCEEAGRGSSKGLLPWTGAGWVPLLREDPDSDPHHCGEPLMVREKGENCESLGTLKNKRKRL